MVKTRQRPATGDSRPCRQRTMADTAISAPGSSAERPKGSSSRTDHTSSTGQGQCRKRERKGESLWGMSLFPSGQAVEFYRVPHAIEALLL